MAGEEAALGGNIILSRMYVVATTSVVDLAGLGAVSAARDRDTRADLTGSTVGLRQQGASVLRVAGGRIRRLWPHKWSGRPDPVAEAAPGAEGGRILPETGRGRRRRPGSAGPLAQSGGNFF